MTQSRFERFVDPRVPSRRFHTAPLLRGYHYRFLFLETRYIPYIEYEIELDLFDLGTEMERRATVVLYALLLAAVIFGVDFLFFRNRLWERLIVNIGIVLVFAAFYLRFLKRR